MPKPDINYEKEIVRKIRVAENAYFVTPYGTVIEAAWKELQKLYKELEEIKNPQ